jgi:hypothetical protein
MSEQIRLSVNTVVDGRWFAAGERLPYKDAAAVPPALQPFVISEDDADDAGPSGPPTLNFQPGRVYDVNPEGAIITRHGRREAARLAGEAAAQAQAEADAEAAGELPPETQAALEDAHAVSIGLQIKAAEIAQARRDDLEEAIRLEALRAGEPAKPAEFHVKRGSVYRRAGDVRLRPGEQLFTRQPNGQWWVAGLVDATGSLPPTETIL